MTAGEIVPDVVNVTIPPGYDIVDIAARLAQDGVCSEAAFLKAVQADDYHQAFLKQLAGRCDFAIGSRDTCSRTRISSIGMKTLWTS